APTPAPAPPTTAPVAVSSPQPKTAVSPSALVSPSAVASPSASPPAAMKPGLSSTDPAVHVFLWGNPGTTARDLGLARDGGFHWVKQRFEWRNIEGKAKGGFDGD